MPVLIDTYNALHAWASAPIREDGHDVAGLARLVARSRHAGDRVRLVCDGTPPGGTESPHRWSAHGCEVRYAGAGNDADSLIESLIAKDTAPKRLLVVSSDRRVQRAAKRRGCPTASSEEFVAECISDAASADAEARARRELDDAERAKTAPPAASPDEVRAWMEEFGYDPSAVAGPEPPEAETEPRGETGARRRDEPAPAAGGGENPPARPRGARSGGPDPETERLAREAQRVWPGRIDPSDLDMEKWLGSPPEADPGPGPSRRGGGGGGNGGGGG